MRTETSTLQSMSKYVTSWMAEVEMLIKSGKFNEAVKLHRTKTGLGLEESKYVCDAIKARFAKEAK